MGATYDSQLPTAKDRMRHSLGDIDMTAPLRDDETYAAILTKYGETEGTAVMAEALAAEYAQQPDQVTDDGTTVTWRDRVKTWLELAARLRKALADTAAQSDSALQSVRPQRYDDRWEERSEYARPGWWTPGG
ncbi:MAG: hypothetical protein BGO39_05015 [Chloroflexi bacterium 54-19]|nr:MAG: hypothetical protein BGO39_05015 [Chloroflexi bacterium 54-19]